MLATHQRILVVGGAGFMGRALTSRLLGSGYAVDVLIGHNTSLTHSLARVHTGGLENIALVRQLLAQCQIVIHAASATTPGTSARNPSLESELNLSPTLRFLEVLQAHPDVHLIYMSSGGTVYGDQTLRAISEESPIQPLSYYGAGKAATEIFLNCFQQNFSGRVTILRPSNLYGPGQPFDSRFGVVRAMLEHVRRDTVMNIWGDGNVVRDFIFIDDLVSACVKTIERQTNGGIYNIGSGEGYSLNNVRQVVEEITGRTLRVQYEPPRSIDVERIVLDISRAKQQLEWEPRVSLPQGIRATWNWINTL
jgi:UDP-glucose 4-epimerase